jgi:hypothetical protein
MKKAIRNIIVNAHESMHGGGTIHVMAKLVDLSNEDAKLLFNVIKGKYARIRQRIF